MLQSVHNCNKLENVQKMRLKEINKYKYEKIPKNVFNRLWNGLEVQMNL